MKYPSNTAKGNAGEYFAAYKISKVLGWPCRIFDIDIGIDIQVEILNEKKESTGRFVALQVKATDVEAVNSWNVGPAHLKYWRELEVPVFVMLVDLRNERMFFHQVEVDGEYEKTRGGKYKIPFDRTKDEFSQATRASFLKASEKRAMQEIEMYLKDVDERVQEMLADIEDVDDCPDPFALIEDMESREDIFSLLNQAEAAARVGKAGYENIEGSRRKLNWVLNDLQNVMIHMKDDYADKADIQDFLKESYESRPETDT